MQNDAVTVQCPNDLCKAANSQADKFCQRCGTPIVKRYLWVVGEGVEAGKIGDLVAERYLLKSNQIFLDTKPGLPPQMPYPEVSNTIKPYLRLIPYQLQVPQVYGLVSLRLGASTTEILLLEKAPIYTDAVSLEGQLMPELSNAWKQASSMRQLNWLWQIAQLWQPLRTEGVASSLLKPEFLRVEGSLLRLLQLQLDGSEPPALAQLGQLWSQLAIGARPAIAGFLKQVCQALQQGEIQSAEQLVAVLDQGLAEVGRSQVRTIRISTCTDTGPSRQHNEDACYPPGGTTITKPPASKALAIVCDGIGGHEGGEVASNLAIETIQQQVETILLEDASLNATTLSVALERLTCVANDKISQRNDDEHRHGRQRMGTTLVTALAHTHEIYITHVGDSRAYWITQTGCHQVTLDDDVASREVRLGYAFYRDALQQGSSGSLVQALGMSTTLHPTVQRFILDDDCVFLLCSDGLSDYDLIDQCWETEILPILEGKVDVTTTSQRLVQIGNTQNGHDNITVGLVHFQINSAEPKSSISLPLTELATATSVSSSFVATDWEEAKTLEPTATASKLKTQLLPSPPPSRPRFMPVLLVIVFLLILGGGIIAYLWQQGRFRPTFWNTTDSTPMKVPSSISSQAPTVSSSSFQLQKGSVIRTISPIKLSQNPESQAQAIAPSPQQLTNTINGILPAMSIVQVLEQQLVPSQGYWLKLKVCSNPDLKPIDAKTPDIENNTTPNSGNVQPSPTPPTLDLGATNSPLPQPGEEGWTSATEIEKNSFLEPDPLKNCPPLKQ